jgi:hypothetical protein
MTDVRLRIDRLPAFALCHPAFADSHLPSGIPFRSPCSPILTESRIDFHKIRETIPRRFRSRRESKRHGDCRERLITWNDDRQATGSASGADPWVKKQGSGSTIFPGSTQCRRSTAGRGNRCRRNKSGSGVGGFVSTSKRSTPPIPHRPRRTEQWAFPSTPNSSRRPSCREKPRRCPSPPTLRFPRGFWPT